MLRGDTFDFNEFSPVKIDQATLIYLNSNEIIYQVPKPRNLRLTGTRRSEPTFYYSHASHCSQ